MIKKVTYKEQVYSHLKEDIIKGDLKPGEIYSEKVFADLLQVSRTPVREAILKLKDEGLVEIYNNRGIGIKPISLDEIQQILQARTAIEGYSVHYLAERAKTQASKKTLEDLKKCLETTEVLSKDLKNHYAYMKSDVEFHGIIVRFTGNRYFIRLVDQMRTRMEQATVNSLTLKNRQLEALQEHINVFECICSGDTQKADAAFRTHMDLTVRTLRKTGLI